MPLFTIILEHRGGTYIQQVSARSVVGALRAWVGRGPALGVPRLGSQASAKALKDEILLMPTPLDAVRNVWCTGLRFGGAYGLINVIATEARALDGKGQSHTQGLRRSAAA